MGSSSSYSNYTDYFNQTSWLFSISPREESRCERISSSRSIQFIQSLRIVSLSFNKKELSLPVYHLHSRLEKEACPSLTFIRQNYYLFAKMCQKSYYSQGGRMDIMYTSTTYTILVLSWNSNLTYPNATGFRG